jgi:hypothetical protein
MREPVLMMFYARWKKSVETPLHPSQPTLRQIIGIFLPDIIVCLRFGFCGLGRHYHHGSTSFNSECEIVCASLSSVIKSTPIIKSRHAINIKDEAVFSTNKDHDLKKINVIPKYLTKLLKYIHPCVDRLCETKLNIVGSNTAKTEGARGDSSPRSSVLNT